MRRWVSTFHLLDGTCLEGKPEELRDEDVEATAAGFSDALANLQSFYFETAHGEWHIVPKNQIARVMFHLDRPHNPER